MARKAIVLGVKGSGGGPGRAVTDDGISDPEEFMHAGGQSHLLDDRLLREMMGLPGPEISESLPSTDRKPRIVQRGYRIKICLAWERRVWRITDLRG